MTIRKNYHDVWFMSLVNNFFEQHPELAALHEANDWPEDEWYSFDNWDVNLWTDIPIVQDGEEYIERHVVSVYKEGESASPYYSEFVHMLDLPKWEPSETEKEEIRREVEKGMAWSMSSYGITDVIGDIDIPAHYRLWANENLSWKVHIVDQPQPTVVCYVRGGGLEYWQTEGVTVRYFDLDNDPLAWDKCKKVLKSLGIAPQLYNQED